MKIKLIEEWDNFTDYNLFKMVINYCETFNDCMLNILPLAVQSSEYGSCITCMWSRCQWTTIKKIVESFLIILMILIWKPLPFLPNPRIQIFSRKLQIQRDKFVGKNCLSRKRKSSKELFLLAFWFYPK